MDRKRGRWTRRGFVRSAALGGLAASVHPATARGVAGQQVVADTELNRDELLHLARALLPGELTDAERTATVDSLLAWLRGYEAGVDMDHGYGFTRLRSTPPSPEPRYIAEMQALRDAARARHGVALTEVPEEALRELAAEAIDAVAPEQDSLPGRPEAAHVTIALISAYTRSAVATDRAYGRQIRRETCRGLFTDVDTLQPYGLGVAEADPAALSGGDR